MQARRIAALAVLAVAAAGVYLPASAAAPKPITKSYAMHLAPAADLCYDPALNEKASHSETFTATGPGKFAAKIEGFQADWDLTLFNADGGVLAIGGGSQTGPDAKVNPTEQLIYKITKPGKYTITSCNFAGTLDAKGSFIFTPNK